MKTKRLIKILVVLLLVGVNISCDQISKTEARQRIAENQIIEVIDSNLILTRVENTGAALSMGENLPPALKVLILQIFPIIVLLGLLWYIIRDPNVTKLQLFAFTCIIGGGVGNIIDRIRFNSVTDFMYVEIGSLHTGIFNMADVSVTFGVILILVLSMVKGIREKFKVSF